mmetsp:Transcript_46730/g.92267  ORF Transcript_46730/g.92267 Transcript_46730/m.92267 type:complete len:181 (+) Transcript_46730:2298-2840(+)
MMPSYGGRDSLDGSFVSHMHKLGASEFNGTPTHTETQTYVYKGERKETGKDIQDGPLSFLQKSEEETQLEECSLSTKIVRRRILPTHRRIISEKGRVTERQNRLTERIMHAETFGKDKQAPAPPLQWMTSYNSFEAERECQKNSRSCGTNASGGWNEWEYQMRERPRRVSCHYAPCAMQV